MLFEIREYLARLSDFLSNNEFYQDSDACASYCGEMDKILGTPAYGKWKDFTLEMLTKRRQLEEKDWEAKEPLRKVKEFQIQISNLENSLLSEKGL